MPFISTSALSFTSLRRVTSFLAPLLLLCTLGQAPSFAEPATKIPAPAVDAPISTAEGLQTAVVAGGCFWGVQAVFQHVNGVSRAVSGYSGGSKATAVYQIVGFGQTGHAEAVEISFDPKKISYGKILQIFFSVAHDPTQLNRQGPDTGPQYRSAIFYQNEAQKRVAEAYMSQLNNAHAFRRPIVTQLNPLEAFYPAESYHQDYAFLHPNNPYIAINDLPKVENLKGLFPDVYRSQPSLVMSERK